MTQADKVKEVRNINKGPDEEWYAVRDFVCRNLKLKAGQRLPTTWQAGYLVRALKEQFGNDVVELRSIPSLAPDMPLDAPLDRVERVAVARALHRRQLERERDSVQNQLSMRTAELEALDILCKQLAQEAGRRLDTVEELTDLLAKTARLKGPLELLRDQLAVLTRECEQAAVSEDQARNRVQSGWSGFSYPQMGQRWAIVNAEIERQWQELEAEEAPAAAPTAENTVVIGEKRRRGRRKKKVA